MHLTLFQSATHIFEELRNIKSINNIFQQFNQTKKYDSVLFFVWIHNKEGLTLIYHVVLRGPCVYIYHVILEGPCVYIRY